MSLRTAYARVVAGHPGRRSRFHDEKGHPLPAADLADLPLDAWLTARRLLARRYPSLPWFTFRAVRRIESLLRPGWSMVEFGSGSSTAWFARRVGSLHSIEHDALWYERVRAWLQDAPPVRYELRTLDAYAALDDHPDGSLDLGVVDGVLRADCVRALVPKLRPGGYLYLDNSDKGAVVPDPDVRAAEAAVLEAAEQRGGTVEYLTGLTVGMVSVHEGLLARL